MSIPEIKKTPGLTLPSVHKAVSEKHTETGIAGHKQEYESKGSYFCSLYAVKTAIGTLVFLEKIKPKPDYPLKTLYPRAFQTGLNRLIYYDFTTVE